MPASHHATYQGAEGKAINAQRRSHKWLGIGIGILIVLAFFAGSIVNGISAAPPSASFKPNKASFQEQATAEPTANTGTNNGGNNGGNTGGSLRTGDNGPCRLDKIGTWSEANDVESYRIEVGGGGTQHVDFYPQRGVKAVSFIVGPRDKAMLWWGFGSIWEGNGQACESFDYVQDATDYATGRLDSGHSGLVFDLRNGVDLVANVNNMSDSDIADLMGQFLPAMHNADDEALGLDFGDFNTGTGGNDNNGGATATKTTGNGGKTTDCKAKKTTHVSVNGESWQITVKGPAIVNFWTNWAGYDQTEHKLYLDAGSYTLNGGGTLYEYPDGCAKQAKSEFKDNDLPEVTLESLTSDGLAS